MTEQVNYSKQSTRILQRVHQLMDRYDFGRELCKVIAEEYPIDSIECEQLCRKIKEVREYISNNEGTEEFATFLFDIHSYLNIYNSKVCDALEAYWYANS